MSYLEHTKDFNTFMEVLLRDPDRYRPIVELRDIMTRQFKELAWEECDEFFHNPSVFYNRASNVDVLHCNTPSHILGHRQSQTPR